MPTFQVRHQGSERFPSSLTAGQGPELSSWGKSESEGRSEERERCTLGLEKGAMWRVQHGTLPPGPLLMKTWMISFSGK